VCLVFDVMLSGSVYYVNDCSAKSSGNFVNALKLSFALWKHYWWVKTLRCYFLFEKKNRIIISVTWIYILFLNTGFFEIGQKLNLSDILKPLNQLTCLPL